MIKPVDNVYLSDIIAFMPGKETQLRRQPYPLTRWEYFRYGQLPAVVDGVKHVLHAQPLFPNMPMLALVATPQVPAIMEQAVFQQAPESQQDERRIIEAVRSMKRYENQIGNRPITFQEASNYVSIVAHFVKEATGFPDKATDLLNRTYVVEGNRQDELVTSTDTPALDRLAIAKLKENYPQMYLTEEIAQDILRAFLEPPDVIPRGRLINNIGVFLYLDMINASAQLKLQFLEETANLRCAPDSPIVQFRTTLIHELLHELSLPEKYNIVEQDMAILGFDILRRIHGYQATRNDAIRFVTMGFDFQAEIWPGNYPDRSFQLHYPGFNEFTTDYLTMQLLKKWGLSYPDGSHVSPHEISNFKRMLVQSGISDEALFDLYRNGELRKFLIRLGRGAQHPNLPSSLDFANEEAMLRHFFFETIGQDTPQWDRLKPYFPQIDTRKRTYKLNPQQKNRNELNPCVMLITA